MAALDYAIRSSLGEKPWHRKPTPLVRGARQLLGRRKNLDVDEKEGLGLAQLPHASGD